MIMNKETKEIVLFLMKQFLMVTAAFVLSMAAAALVPVSITVGCLPAGLLIAPFVYGAAIIVARKTRWARLQGQ